jgi:hypothetical protein
MSHKRKTRPGQPIRSLARFVADVEEGRPGFYFNGRLLNMAWVQNWSLRYIQCQIRRRSLFECVPTEAP